VGKHTALEESIHQRSALLHNYEFLILAKSPDLSSSIIVVNTFNDLHISSTMSPAIQEDVKFFEHLLLVMKLVTSSQHKNC
jgi:hypothetical protein